MSRELEVRQIRVPRSLGYFVVEGHSYFLSDYLDGSVLLNEHLSSLSDWQQKRHKLNQLACWVKKIHMHNIWQRDFKSTNILCQSGDFFMVDLDDIKIQQPSHLDKITNLAQLNASISNVISLKDRLRFLHYYWANENLSRDHRREIYRKIWEISLKKNTTFYDLDLNKLKPGQK